ncbi:MAG: hypothetical protein R3C10_14285 [Pirellulales bacterium]
MPKSHSRRLAMLWATVAAGLGAVIFVRVGLADADEPDDTAAAIQQIRSVGTEGAGSEAATDAWRHLTRGGVDQLPSLLVSAGRRQPVGGELPT